MKPYRRERKNRAKLTLLSLVISVFMVFVAAVPAEVNADGITPGYFPSTAPTISLGQRATGHFEDDQRDMYHYFKFRTGSAAGTEYVLYGEFLSIISKAPNDGLHFGLEDTFGNKVFSYSDNGAGYYKFYLSNSAGVTDNLKYKLNPNTDYYVWVYNSTIAYNAKNYAVTISAVSPAAEQTGQFDIVYKKVINGSKYELHSNDGTGAPKAILIKAKNAKTVTIPAVVSYDGKKYPVKGIKKKSFKSSKAKTVTIKTKNLTKTSVTGSLIGSKVKTIKVKVGSKSLNKKTIKKYKKYFTKANAGKKVKVK